MEASSSSPREPADRIASPNRENGAHCVTAQQNPVVVIIRLAPTTLEVNRVNHIAKANTACDSAQRSAK
jgi:hypothetical protein